MITTSLATPRAIDLLRRDHILPSDAAVDSRDTVFVAHRRQFPLAVLTARPVWWVHGLDLNPSAPPILARRALQPLLSFAFGYSIDRPLVLRGAILQVSPDNDSMKGTAEQFEAAAPDLGLIYRLDF